MKLLTAPFILALLATTAPAQTGTNPGVVSVPTKPISPTVPTPTVTGPQVISVVPTPTVTPVPVSPPVTVMPINVPVTPVPINMPVTPVPISTPVTPVLIAAEMPAAGETSVTLDVGNGIRAVAASRVTVPVGERLRVTGPDAAGRSVQWFKDGAALSGATTNPLLLAFVTSTDAGTYTMKTTDANGTVLPSQDLMLGVGPTDRLLNLSTRAVIGGGADQGFVAGFVAGGGARPKKLILRAVGPSLAQFGVANALRRPVLEVFAADGTPYRNGYFYPAVVGGPTFEKDLADSLARSGAFPTPAGSADVVLMMPFNPGPYTARVTSADGTGGAVLLEIYEVP